MAAKEWFVAWSGYEKQEFRWSVQWFGKREDAYAFAWDKLKWVGGFVVAIIMVDGVDIKVQGHWRCETLADGLAGVIRNDKWVNAVVNELQAKVAELNEPVLDLDDGESVGNVFDIGFGRQWPIDPALQAEVERAAGEGMVQHEPQFELGGEG